VNWAVWARNCEESVGFIGSWFFSWVTISLRNMSLFIWSVEELPDEEPVPVAVVAAGVPK
jgi:hypothetical protein